MTQRSKTPGEVKKSLWKFANAPIKVVTTRDDATTLCPWPRFQIQDFTLVDCTFNNFRGQMGRTEVECTGDYHTPLKPGRPQTLELLSSLLLIFARRLAITPPGSHDDWP